MKKILAVILALVTIVTAIPFMAFAQRAENADENGQLLTESTAQGISSVGNILADTFNESQEIQEQAISELACMSGFEFDGETATVVFQTQVDAKLVVAIYTEDGTKMLTSEVKDVTTEDTSATITIKDASLPEYYLAKAFLLDANTSALLCNELTDDTHTQAYQEFMELDIYDFNADNVINLDTNTENNFLVIAEDLIEIMGDSSANTLVSADYDTGEYVFENPKATLENLKSGDIFYYVDGDSYEIVEIIKVKSAIKGINKITIIADENIELDEAFECIKIDTSELTAENTAKSRSARTNDINLTKEFLKGKFTIKIEKDEKGKISGRVTEKTLDIGQSKGHDDEDSVETPSEPGGDVDVAADITLEATLSAVLTISFYKDYEKVEFVVTGEAGIDVSVKMSFETLIHLGSFGFSPVAGLYISCDLDFKLSFDVTLSLHFDVIFTEGFEFSTLTKKFTSIRNFDFNSEIKIEGKISIGFVITPKVSVVTESFITIQLPISPMFVITATTAIDTTTGTIDTENHDCDYCIDGSTDFEITAQAKLVFFNSKRFTYSLPKLKVDFHLFDFYFSLTHSEFGLGKCPYSKSITVSGKCGDSLTWGIDEEDGILYIDGSGNMTDFDSEDAPWAEYKKIIKTVYIGKEVTGIGNNAFEKCSKIKNVYFYGTETQWKQITIGTNNKYLTDAQIRYLDLSDPGTDINPEDADGKCGDNVYWKFDSSTGTLTIFGTGDMYDYDYNNRPWTDYENKIKTVVIADGVTSVGDSAFEDCIKLTRVIISNSVIDIGISAFEFCSALTDIVIPNSVESIGGRAFYKCASLTNITIPDKVTSIIDYTFYYCTKLTSITFGKELTSIGDRTFYYCINLTNIIIPDGVTSIGHWSFYHCDSLTSVIIPDSVMMIGTGAFDYCYELTDVYYAGSKNEWDAINIYTYNTILTNATIHYNYNGTSVQSVFSLTENVPVTYSLASAQAETDIVNFVYNYCVAGNKYVLLNVLNYGDDFELTTDNLLYIDIVTADKNGKIDKLFEPYLYDEQSNILLIGDFGNGVEIRAIDFIPTFYLEADKDRVEIGDTFTVSAKVSDFYKLGAVTVDLIYDPDTVKIVDSSYNSSGLFNPTYKSDKVRFTSAYLSMYNTDELFSVQFEVIGYDDIDIGIDVLELSDYYENQLNYSSYGLTVRNRLSIYIQEPSRTTIRCKDGIYLYPIVDGGLPEGTYIYWETSNDNFDVDYMADDSIMITSQNDGYTDITVYLLNYEDDSVIDSYTIEMYSKAGFFDKIGGFFRSLFGSTKIYEN